jgi:hypothetical protein
MGWSSIGFSTGSVVVPGTSETIETCLLSNRIQQTRFAHISAAKETNVQPESLLMLRVHSSSLFFLDKNVTFAAPDLVQHRQGASGLLYVHVLQLNRDQFFASRLRLGPA